MSNELKTIFERYMTDNTLCCAMDLHCMLAELHHGLPIIICFGVYMDVGKISRNIFLVYASTALSSLLYFVWTIGVKSP